MIGHSRRVSLVVNLGRCALTAIAIDGRWRCHAARLVDSPERIRTRPSAVNGPTHRGHGPRILRGCRPVAALVVSAQRSSAGRSHRRRTPAPAPAPAPARSVVDLFTGVSIIYSFIFRLLLDVVLAQYHWRPPFDGIICKFPSSLFTTIVDRTRRTRCASASLTTIAPVQGVQLGRVGAVWCWASA